ncbi:MULTISPECIES: diguanylate cyclase [unclassified Clostridium]|uniref:diguanylate cyclase n=1 Tax=unclassified Clostridium TaxID=2614128 RepID=UPI000E4AF43B|nr:MULTISPECIES: diguanylate cyclase [unclassified Clostridium]RHP44958.1 diguanylate cyclase [Clostridium sp. AF32-12BH]RHV69646.1 diguanylate cyclase [Clostridium sp. OM02-18AC]
MNSYDKLTRQQAEEQMELYRQVFTAVRLLDAADLRLTGAKKTKEDQTGGLNHCYCYDYWKKSQPCENCISRKVYQDGIQRTKLEYRGNDLFEVTARYVEVDGTPYIMELVRAMDGTCLIDAEGREKLLIKLTSYHDELYIDALTGAYNRRYYEDKIKTSAQKGGVAMIDLDDFKLYNDTWGHDAGDAVLRTLVQMLRNCVRDEDSIIRYGGDEFLLLMPDISQAQFEESLRRVKEKVCDADVPGYTNLRLSVSIGGVLSDGSKTVEDAAICADKLMYQAKNRKNTVVTEGTKQEVQHSGDNTEDQENIKQQILIVDDSGLNREILSEMLHSDFRILEAENGKECIAQLEQYGTGIALVLLDIVMPVMNGFEVLEYMTRNHWIEEVPVIMISSENSEPYIRKAYELGVSDYISRPFDAKVVFQRVFNTIKLYAKQHRLIKLVTSQIYEKEKNNRIMVGILSQIMEFRNGESGRHVFHINRLTDLLLERLTQKTNQYHLSRPDRELIATASALHDIGKIGIDEQILNKPGRLTKAEFEIMKTHTVIGASMLKHLTAYQNEPIVKIAYQICRWHHERYDGKGYPDGLKGEEIPIAAQVVSIVDVYDALVSPRVYKKAFPHEQAMSMIMNGECGTFNPLLLECLIEIQDRIQAYDHEPQNH